MEARRAETLGSACDSPTGPGPDAPCALCCRISGGMRGQIRLAHRCGLSVNLPLRNLRAVRVPTLDPAILILAYGERDLEPVWRLERENARVPVGAQLDTKPG